MATVTRENIQPLHDKLIVKVEKEDYLPSFEKKIKSLTKSANLPGFRKGMVPTGLMKKMYGRDIMREEIEIALNEKLKSYIEKEKLHLIGQPIVLEQLKAIDLEEVNQPVDHEFAFEIGLQPEIKVDVKDIPVTRYLVNVSEEKIDADIKNLQRGHGKKIDLDVIGNRNEDTTIDANFKETDKDGNEIENGFNTPVNHLAMTKFTDAAFELLNGKKKDDTVVVQLNQAFEGKNLEEVLKILFYKDSEDKEVPEKVDESGADAENKEVAEKFTKITINEIHQFEEAPLGETLFEAVFPGQEIKTEEAFRAKIKENYDDAYKERSRTHLNDQLYHYLLEHTEVELPKDFIMRWMQAGSEEKKSTEEIEKKYLTYTGLLKWQIISTKLQRDFRITVTIPEFNAYVIHRLSDMYGGGIPFADNPEWLKDYTEKALKNEKYVNEAYHYISNDKIFSQLENMAQVKEESINENDFFETVRRYKIEHNNSFELGEHNHEHEHNHTHEHEHEHEHNHEH